MGHRHVSVLKFGNVDDVTDGGCINAGKHTCSYRAEALTIDAGIEHLLRRVQNMSRNERRSSIILGTDSQSTLAALARGPLDQDDPVCSRIWTNLLKLAAQRVHIRLQFCYAHVGFLENELVDSAAKHMAERARGLALEETWWKDAARWTFTRRVKPRHALERTQWCTGEVELEPTKHR
eukprot:PhM_4_TR9004/c0_g1_i1/m.2362